MNHSSTSTYTANFVQIVNFVDGGTYEWTLRQTLLGQFRRSTQSNQATFDIFLIVLSCFCCYMTEWTTTCHAANLSSAIKVTGTDKVINHLISILVVTLGVATRLCFHYLNTALYGRKNEMKPLQTP